MYKKQLGLTLIELIVAMALSGILFSVLGGIAAQPIKAYRQISIRAQLVEAADQALRRLTRDIQSAVPNSLRIAQSGSVLSLEMLNTVEGLRYRVLPSLGGSEPVLNFSTEGSRIFNTVIPFQYALDNSTCMRGACRLVVYNTAATTNGSSSSPAPGANVYSTLPGPACSVSSINSCFPPPGSYTITPSDMKVTLSNNGARGEGQVVLSAPVQFAIASPNKRLYVSDTPVMYICTPNIDNTEDGTLIRYWDYPITETQSTRAPIGSSSSQLTQFVTSCQMTYQAGTTARNGMINLSLTLSHSGESITLMRQVAVSNVP